MDHIVVHCECGETLRVKMQHGGRNGNCKNCQISIEIPSADVIEANLGREVSLGELSTLGGEPVEPTKEGPGISDTEKPDATVTGLWQPGQLVDGRYQVEKKLGQGGCGIVWKARHTEWNIDLAVKEFIDDENLKPEKRERRRTNFVRESQAWVDDIGMHPHVVTAWYVRELQATPYLFLEYCEGGDLGDWIDQGKTRDLKTALDIAIQLAWGLAHCHERGIVHRDFKPQNVMMTAAGTAKITDFGMVKFAATESDDDEAADETGSGDIRQTLAGRGPLGTPPYMPPEQWGTGQIDHRADLYALGVTIYELLSGKYPIVMPSRSQFPAGGAGYRAWLNACAEAHGEDPPASLIDKRDDISAELEQFVQTCLAKQADNRPSDSSKIVQTLLQIFETTTGESYGRAEPSEIQPLADGLNNQGVSLVELGRQLEAERRFAAAVDSEPHHPEATYNLGLLRWRKGDITDVMLVDQLREVCASHHDQWIDEYLLAQVQVERGNDQEALTLLESIAGVAGNVPEVVRVLAELRADDLSIRRGECFQVFEGHARWVNSVSLSTDDCFAVSGSNDGSVRLWSVAGGNCLMTFKGESSLVNSVSFSADNNYVLSGGEDDTLRLWRVADGTCLRTFKGHTEWVWTVSISPDSRYALSGSMDKTVRMWRITDGKCMRVFEGHTGQVKSVSFSSDGGYVFSGSNDKTIRQWNVSSGKCVRTFKGHSSPVHSVSVFADRNYLLSGSQDKTVRLWDTVSGQCVKTFEGHTKSVESVCFSEDGRYALSGSKDETVRLWDVTSGECLWTFEGHTAGVTSVAFSADGRFVISGCEDTTARLWQIGRPGHRRAAFCLTQVTDTITQLQTQTGVDSQLEKAYTAVRNHDLGEALKEIRLARSSVQNSRRPKLLSLWTDLYSHLPRTGFRGGWHLRTFEGQSKYSMGVNSVSLSSDNRYALSGSNDNTVNLWDVTEASHLRTFKGHTDRVSSVSFSADGDRFLSGSWDKTLRQWDVASGECQREFEGHAGEITSVVFSRNGERALSGSCDKTMRLWDIASGKSLKTFVGHTKEVSSVAFSPDCRYVLSGSKDSTVRLWDAKSGKCLHNFSGHAMAVNSVSFSDDCRYVLSGSDDQHLRLWDVARRKLLRIFHGHSDRVSSVALSLDGRYAISGSGCVAADERGDDTIRVWNIADGTCLRTFEGHDREVTSVTFSEDGCYVLSGSADATVRLWFLDWDLENREPADWAEEARSYLQIFLTLHAPAKKLLRAKPKPTWSESDFEQLMTQLGHAGFGWLRPEGVKQKLLEMAADWAGPPPLGGWE